MKRAYLVLEDGSVFEGFSFGADLDAVGELVFTVGGMCGYLETISDPSYYGKIVVQTFPIIGNYGVIAEDLEGECALAGYVVREYCDTPSNFRCEGTLGDFLKAKGIPALCGVDTRALTVLLREKGCMNAKICTSLSESAEELKEYKVKTAIEAVSCKKKTVFAAEGEELYRITAIDCGIKKSFIKQLNSYGATVTLMPVNSGALDIMSTAPQGVLVAGGPGDPKDCGAVDTVRALLGKVPMLGIGLGHQIMALAAGGDTVKMKTGHRGGSQTVKSLVDGKCYITNQNHGFEVVNGSVKGAVTTMVNLNDGGCEALDYGESKAFSVQFYPEVQGAPGDGSFVYNRFFDRIRGV